MDTLFIEGLEFYGYHGATDEEQAVGHRYQVDVSLQLDLSSAAESDRLDHTVNYAAAAKRIIAIGTTTRFRLLEALAEELARTLLAEFPSVRRVRLRLAKIYPPMNAIAKAAGVEIERTR
ncbi:MAG: dihydroneopterin aldolase [Chthonomonadales bacterium]